MNNKLQVITQSSLLRVKMQLEITRKLLSKQNDQENIDSSSDENLIKNSDANYNNNLKWWNSLQDEWKILLMRKSAFEDEIYDISKIPTNDFLNSLFERKVFSNFWESIDTIKPLNNLTKLRHLYLDAAQIKDFSEISNMTFIEEIIADNSKIESLVGLENFENLTKLTISNTDVTTLKPIATLENLIDLDIRGTLINPNEFELFRKLHPKTTIDFITPMNPLRRNKESLENPLLDYYRNLCNKANIHEIQITKPIKIPNNNAMIIEKRGTNLLVIDALSISKKVESVNKDFQIGNLEGEFFYFHKEYLKLVEEKNITIKDLTIFEIEDLLYGINKINNSKNEETCDVILYDRHNTYFKMPNYSNLKIGTTLYNINVISEANAQFDFTSGVIDVFEMYKSSQFIVDDNVFNKLFEFIIRKKGRLPKTIHVFRERNYNTSMEVVIDFLYWLQWDAPIYIAYVHKYCRQNQIHI